MKITFKNALLTDLTTIVEIYNSTIPSGMVTADTKPVSIKSKVLWFKQHNSDKRPLLLIKNERKHIIGWVSFQSFYGRPAYNNTAEVSIYLHAKVRGKGLGKMVLDHCIAIAPDLGIKTLLGFIFSHNEQSLKLFRHLGFEDWATLPGVAVLDEQERSLKILGKRIA